MHKHQTLILCFLYIIEIFVLVDEETDGIDLKQAYLMLEILTF